MKRIALALALTCGFGIGEASAQFYYQQGGSKTSFANPDQVMTNAWRNRGCRDPWVAIALNNVYGQVNPALCGIALYNGGQWSNFNQLQHAVAATRSALQSQNVSVKLVRLPSGQTGVGFLQGGRMVAAGGGNLLGNDGGSMVAAGGGNLIGNDGGSLTAHYIAPGQRTLQNARGAIRLPVGQIAY